MGAFVHCMKVKYRFVQSVLLFIEFEIKKVLSAHCRDEVRHTSQQPIRYKGCIQFSTSGRSLTCYVLCIRVNSHTFITALLNRLAVCYHHDAGIMMVRDAKCYHTTLKGYKMLTLPQC